MPTNDTASFLRSKFDNICLLFAIVMFIGLLTWVDKHGNSDYEKWLEVFITGFGGAYLCLITAARQAWEKHNGVVSASESSSDPTAPVPPTIQPQAQPKPLG